MDKDLTEFMPSGQEYHGIDAGVKAADLPDEAWNEFSDAPFEFEETAAALWRDTRKTYYHACTANRFSENYLKLCVQLEKNIRQLGSFCLTKAVMEQKEMAFPDLADLSIRDLVGMVSFHLRKAHAAFEGIYQDNNLLGITYLNWEFRWFGLGNRLKATEVKIQNIKAGKINTDAMLEQAETFKGEKRTNQGSPDEIPASLRANPNAMPILGTMAREMLKREAEAEKREMEYRKMIEDIAGIWDTKPDWDLIDAITREKSIMTADESLPAENVTEADGPESCRGGTVPESEFPEILPDDGECGDEGPDRQDIPVQDPRKPLDSRNQYSSRPGSGQCMDDPVTKDSPRSSPSADPRKLPNRKRKKKKK